MGESHSTENEVTNDTAVDEITKDAAVDDNQKG